MNIAEKGIENFYQYITIIKGNILGVIRAINNKEFCERNKELLEYIKSQNGKDISSITIKDVSNGMVLFSNGTFVNCNGLYKIFPYAKDNIRESQLLIDNIKKTLE